VRRRATVRLWMLLLVLNVRGKNYAALRDSKNAIKDYEEVIKLAGNTPLAGVALQAAARIHKNAEEYDEMISKYETLISSMEDLDEAAKVNAHYWCAWGYFKKEEFKKARASAAKVREFDSAEYAKQISMLDLLSSYQLKDRKAAVMAAKEVGKAGVANDVPMGIYRWLGVQCYRAGETEDAQTFLSLGVTNLKPAETPVYYWRVLAKCQCDNKQYQWAIQSVTHALDLETDEAQKVNMELYKAICQYGLNKPELAKATTINVLQQNPSGRTKAMGLKLLGNIYFKEQNFKEAAISFASITEFYEDTEILPYAITMIIKSLEASNKPTDAALFKKRLEKDFPDYELPE